MLAGLKSLWLGFLVLFFVFELNFGGKDAKKKNYRIPMLRTKRDLRDKQGIPTENLKGRPGQGYYIAANLGNPPQRVSSSYPLSLLGKFKVSVS